MQVRGTVRSTIAALALASTPAALLAGCTLGRPGVSCAAVDAFAFTTPQQLGQVSDVVVRGHVTAVGKPHDADQPVVTQTFTLAVDDVLGTADGPPGTSGTTGAAGAGAGATGNGTALAAGSESFVALGALNARCPVGATPTPGYAGYPLEGEVPAVGADVIAFLDEPATSSGDGAGGGSDGVLPSVLGYALVDGDRATFAAVTGPLRGQTFDVAAIEDAAREGLATAGPVG